ncbi:FG-GAP-like repeat-containing protein [Streptomyces sp. S.PNR 29]|uniref:FG-GAP-like repeat-containing protein n=1 Tax=Streptomyces sp. S.PNR 29 TaxID=2973805 RepID=UPI0025B01F10|nr:FG-GAP-like repeat-containing protein [Streptomyces sp. S.PNR 29]MDN0200976.1 FG-GAP-like repeat-containing protein [Streptomyces sp. S.PNR 29]
MSKYGRTWRTGLAVVMAVAGAVALPAGHAVAEKNSVELRDDFNGDGYADLAVAAPQATVDGKTNAGYVAVVYGSADGLKTSTKQVFSQNTAGVPGAAETDDRFGSELTTADLDRDGYTDLVVGVGGEDTASGGTNSGSVQAVWGGPQGLSGGSSLVTGRSVEGAYGGLGSHGSLTVGDVDGDGATDLVAVENYWKLRVVKGPFGRDGVTNGGEQTVLDDSDPRFLDLATGDVNGDGIDDVVGTMNDGDEYDARRITYWKGTPDGLAQGVWLTDTDGDRLQGGESLDLGDVDADGYDDIVVGRHDGHDSDLLTPIPKGGRVAYIPGGANGPAAEKATYLNQDSPGVPGAAELDDDFGADVSVADVDGDGYADVSAGVPGEDFDGVDGTGAVVVLRGGAGGLTGTGATVFSQNTEGVPGTAENRDQFGRATRLLDGNGDGRAELVVGAPGENAGAGSVWVLRSTASGITPTGSFTFGAGTLGTVAANARLGSGFAY